MDNLNLEQGTAIETPAILDVEIEELELKIAPGRGVNHNETLVLD